MTFDLTLNSPRRDPVDSADLGFETQVIHLVSPDGTPAVDPTLTDLDPKDEEFETEGGDDHVQHERKRVTVDLDIDWIDTATKQQIDELRFNGRDIHICGNYDRHTIFSHLLMRDLDEQQGGDAWAVARASDVYRWDDNDKVIHKAASGDAAFAFNCGYLRGLTTALYHVNRASTPHPTSSGHGWTNLAGTNVFAYTESILSPVLAQRAVTNARGVLAINSPRTGSAAVNSVRHTSSGHSGTADLKASLVLKATGRVSVTLRDSAGSNVDTVQIDTSTDEWQRIQLIGANGSGGTTADVVITFLETSNALGDASQTAIVGPIVITDARINGTDYEPCPPHIPTTAQKDAITKTSTTFWASGYTISFFTRYTANRAGWLNMARGSSSGQYVYKHFKDDGTYPDSMYVGWRSASPVSAGHIFGSLAAEFGLVEGDLMHVVVVVGIKQGARLYVNGLAHSDNGTVIPDLPAGYGSTHDLGAFNASDYALEDNFISLLRFDSREWTEEDVLDHYDTYGDPYSVGTIERFLGRVFTIEETEWSLRLAASEVHQWIGRITLRELALDGAPMQEQEGL